MAGIDQLLLDWLNTYLARSPGAFTHAIALSDRTPWLLMAFILAALWFVGESGAVPTRRGGKTRLQSRRHVVLTLVAMVLVFILARALQHIVPRSRPLVDLPLQIPIEPQVWSAIRGSLELQGAFPSEHAAILFAVTTGAFSLDRRLGFLAILGSLYFCALRIGIGFQWPSDILAGALLGVLATSLILAAEPLVRPLLEPLLLLFEHRPALVYPVGFLILFDLSQKFAILFAVLAMVFGHALGV